MRGSGQRWRVSTRERPLASPSPDWHVILHENREGVKRCQDVAAEWLQEMGLARKPSHTRIPHTVTAPEGTPGLDFLGVQIRPYPIGKTTSGKDCRGRGHGVKTPIKLSKIAIQRHVDTLRKIVDSHKHAEQEELIGALNPVLIGWTPYYAHVASAKVFQGLGNMLHRRLGAWAVSRHPNKTKPWLTSKYWRVDEGRGWRFPPFNGGPQRYRHEHTPIRMYVKVQASRSLYDGDWVYWSSRLGRHPDVSPRLRC
jgi:RNA-directed DNA polymerase